MNTHTEKNDKGFTLVELLIVIVILGILATVTVFAVRGITDQGQTSACNADRKTIEVAAESYMAQEGGYPADLATLESSGLLRGVTSGNWTYGYVAYQLDSDPGTAGNQTVNEGYTLTATAGGPCV